MIIYLNKQMHTRIIGQPQRKSMGQSKRVDGFVYSFISNILAEDMDWDSVEDVLTETIVAIGCSTNTVKDMEISLDIPSGQYSLRFSSTVNLSETEYYLEINWIVQAMDGTEYYITTAFPKNQVNDKYYEITTKVTNVPLVEIENLARKKENET